MELQLVLERLAFTIEKAKELQPEQFDYSAIVREFDIENFCGTVCCIVGHYPNWNIPDFKYFAGHRLTFFVHYKNGQFSLGRSLEIYHGLSFDIVSFLFFGEPLHDVRFIQYSDSTLKLPLKAVIERFEYVYELLKTKQITPDFTA